jgi:hypothetical protein
MPDCLPCAAGSYQTRGGQTGCYACKTGSFCPERSVSHTGLKPRPSRPYGGLLLTRLSLVLDRRRPHRARRAPSVTSRATRRRPTATRARPAARAASARQRPPNAGLATTCPTPQQPSVPPAHRASTSPLVARPFACCARRASSARQVPRSPRSAPAAPTATPPTSLPPRSARSAWPASPARLARPNRRRARPAATHPVPYGRMLDLLAWQVQQPAATARVPHVRAWQVLPHRQYLAAALRGRNLQQRVRCPCQGRLPRVHPRHRVQP